MYVCMICTCIDREVILLMLQLPKSLVPHYMECVSTNPKSRPNPSSLLSRLREHSGFLATPLISIALRIEELQVCDLAVQTSRSSS